jgi:hypothetical protein
MGELVREGTLEKIGGASAVEPSRWLTVQLRPAAAVEALSLSQHLGYYWQLICIEDGIVAAAARGFRAERGAAS